MPKSRMVVAPAVDAVTVSVGRKLARWIDPPGAPWWRIYAVVLGPPVAIVVLVDGLHLVQVIANMLAWIR